VLYNLCEATLCQRSSRHMPCGATAIVVLSLVLQSHAFDPAICEAPAAQHASIQTNRVITYERSVVHHEIAAFLPLPWQYSSLALGRSLLAVHAPKSEVAFQAGIAAPERGESLQLVRWMHRRCLCQLLDIPPPLYVGL
jgi:hypothetical protein